MVHRYWWSLVAVVPRCGEEFLNDEPSLDDFRVAEESSKPSGGASHQAPTLAGHGCSCAAALLAQRIDVQRGPWCLTMTQLGRDCIG